MYLKEIHMNNRLSALLFWLEEYMLMRGVKHIHVSAFKIKIEHRFTVMTTREQDLLFKLLEQEAVLKFITAKNEHEIVHYLDRSVMIIGIVSTKLLLEPEKSSFKIILTAIQDALRTPVPHELLENNYHMLYKTQLIGAITLPIEDEWLKDMVSYS